MTATAQKETLDFQAEVSQVLNLVIRSLYSNKEIFLRELISNASDAAEKLRFEALGNDALYEGDSELRIRVTLDKRGRDPDGGRQWHRHEPPGGQRDHRHHRQFRDPPIHREPVR
jgi:hypothetical protein